MVAQRGSEDPRTWKWTMGSEAVQFDVNAFALAKAAEVLASTYTEGVAPPPVIYIFSTDNSALQAIRNPQSIKAHSHCICFHKALTTFFLSHRDVRLILAWSPKNDDLRGNLLSRTLAAEASQEFPPEGMDSAQSAAYQKGRAKARAYQQWECQYRHNCMQEEFRTMWLGTVIAPPRFCYQHAISEPPSVHHHPLWKEATSLTKKVAGQRRKPKYTRCYDKDLQTDFYLFTRCIDTGVIETHALSFCRPLAPLFLLTHAQLAVVTQSCTLLYIAAHCDLLLQ